MGYVYDERAGWVAYGVCSGTGRATVFVYDQARRRSRSPRGGDLEHVGSVLACMAFVGSCAVCGASGTYTELHSVPEDRLTFFEGDLLCGECASAHGVL